MTISTKNTQSMMEVTQSIIANHGSSQEELISILSEVNLSFGYLPEDALNEISERLRLPKSHVISVATFYHMLSTEPRGKHVVKFCDSAPCHVVGGKEVWETLTNELKLNAGETSADGKWTLTTTSCLGLCGVGPVIVVDEDIHGNVTSEQVCEILSRYD